MCKFLVTEDGVVGACDEILMRWKPNRTVAGPGRCGDVVQVGRCDVM